MPETLALDSPAGTLHLRTETDADADFRYRLFCDSRPPEWDQVQLPFALREQLMRHQFAAQTASYRAEFPHARFDVIELEAERIGRSVVDRRPDSIRLIDIAIVPAMRGRGIGTAILRALIDEAARAGVPVRLTVATGNDPSLRLYLELGFVEVEALPMYRSLEWRPAGSPHSQHA